MFSALIQLVKSHITFQRAANKENLVLPLQSLRQKALVQVSTRLLDFPVNATPNAERLTKVEKWCNKLWAVLYPRPTCGTKTEDSSP